MWHRLRLWDLPSISHIFPWFPPPRIALVLTPSPSPHGALRAMLKIATYLHWSSSNKVLSCASKAPRWSIDLGLTPYLTKVTCFSTAVRMMLDMLDRWYITLYHYIMDEYHGWISLMLLDLVYKFRRRSCPVQIFSFRPGRLQRSGRRASQILGKRSHPNCARCIPGTGYRGPDPLPNPQGFCWSSTRHKSSHPGASLRNPQKRILPFFRSQALINVLWHCQTNGKIHQLILQTAASDVCSLVSLPHCRWYIP